VTADYDVRVQAVRDATDLMLAMQPPAPQPIFGGAPAPRPLDRFEVVELARFLLGLDDETQQAPDADVAS
jgi:hypothetical protein